MNAYIGIDLGGTNLKYALGNEQGKLFIKRIKPSRAKESRAVIFQNIFEAIEELKSEFNGEISGVAMGTPGIVDFDNGKLIGAASNIPAWTDASIKRTLESTLKIPVWVDNDANVVALAEARVGAAIGYSDIVCVTIGTGIGGGIIINNELYRGSNFSAAEIGHMVIEMNGTLCACGNRGCLEAYSSAPAMVERYRQKLIAANKTIEETKLTTEIIFEQAKHRDVCAKETINEVCDYLGTGIANVINIVNPQIVVIGGGVADAGSGFIKKIEKVVYRKVLKPNCEHLKIVNAKLGNDAGIIGAIILAAEKNIDHR